MLPLKATDIFSKNNFFFTERISSSKIEATLDSLFFNLGKFNKNKSLSMQFLSTYLEKHNFIQLKAYIKAIENNLALRQNIDAQLSEMIKCESYSNELRELQSQFRNIEHISEEFNVKVTIFKSFEDRSEICKRKYYSSLNLFIFEHKPNQYEVLGNTTHSGVFQELLKPSVVEKLENEIHSLLKSRLLTDSINKEGLKENLEYINSRFGISFDTSYLESPVNPDYTSNSIIQEISPKLPRLNKINTQQFLPEDFDIFD